MFRMVMRGRDTGCSSNVKVRGILTAGSPHASASGTSFEVCENSGITVRIETESLCELHRKTHLWRLPVVNFGSRPARSATTEVKEVEDNGVMRVGVVAAPLNWMHNPNGIYTRDIFRTQVAYLDICQWTPEFQPRPVLSNSPVAGVPLSNGLPEDNVKIKVEFYQESGQHADVRIALTLDAEHFENSIVEIVRVVRQRRLLFLTWPKEINSAKASSDFDGIVGTW